jgi:hypothetical protein
MISRRDLLRTGLGAAGVAALGGPLWTAHATTSWDRLRTALTGDLVRPGDAAYPTARQLDNGFFDSVSPAGIGRVLPLRAVHRRVAALSETSNEKAGWTA